MVAPAPHAVREVVERALGGAGFVLEGLELHRAGARSTLVVLVDLAEDTPGELDLDRVGEATTVVSAALDADPDVIPGHYTLEVSSPGATRDLTQRRHYARNVGRRVRLELVDGGVLVGVLRSVEGDGTLVVVPEEARGKGRPPRVLPARDVPVTAVRVGRVELDLRGLGPVADDERVPDDEHDEDEHDDDEHDEQDGPGALAPADGRKD